jgi:SAM-dependent methyltransferase
VEPSGNPTGREKLGLTIFNEPVDVFLRRPGFAGGFDVAIAHHVIEHCYDPALLLVQLRQLLRPGGHAVIATPNIRGLSMRWKTLVSRLGWKSRPFRHLDYPKHLVLFEPGNLARLLGGAGFELVELSTHTRGARHFWTKTGRFAPWGRIGPGDNMLAVARRPPS